MLALAALAASGNRAWLDGNLLGVYANPSGLPNLGKLPVSQILFHKFLENRQPDPVKEIDPSVELVHKVLQAKVPTLKAAELMELSKLFINLCQQYNFSPAFILGLIHVESNFQPHVESVAGAVGLMQIMPATGKPIALALGLAWKGKNTLRDPKTNLRIGFHYLNYLRGLFNGKSPRYVTAYNWGPAHVGNLVQARRQLPLDYFRKVERQQKQYAFLDQQVAR